MRLRISTLGLILAWFCANGAIWDVVQVFGWVRMYAQFSEYLPVSQALEKTFDGSKPCEICGVAQRAHDAAKNEPRALPESGSRLVLACDDPGTVILTREYSAWPDAVSRVGELMVADVPVPPPRAHRIG